MKCPGCTAEIEETRPHCPRCQLSLRRLDEKFGVAPLSAAYLTDRAGKLSLREIERLRDELRLFEKRFPQARFSVFIAELPADTSASEYAFWLANRGGFNLPTAVGGANFDLLLVIDCTSAACALTIGYGLEPWLSDADLQEALATFREGAEIQAGVRACLEQITRRLRGAAK